MSKENKYHSVSTLYKRDVIPIEIEMVGMNDEVDVRYGCSTSYITLEQIEQLKNGKVFYFDDGEYAHLIRVEDGDNNDT